MPWIEPNLEDPDPRYWPRDPADLYDAFAELLEAVQPPAWWSRAACRGRGVGAWFVGRGGSLTAARAVCESCPVQGRCLQTALAMGDGDDAGIWAGTTPRQRRKLRRAITVDGGSWPGGGKRTERSQE